MQAIFLQNEYRKAHNGQSLPIYEISQHYGGKVLRELSTEQIKELWIDMCRDYLDGLTRQLDTVSKEDLLKLDIFDIDTIETLKTRSMYGNESEKEFIKKCTS